MIRKLRKEWKENDGLRLLVWIFLAFFMIVTLAWGIERLLWNPTGYPIGIA